VHIKKWVKKSGIKITNQISDRADFGAEENKAFRHHQTGQVHIAGSEVMNGFTDFDNS
jgi:hypothetical protein